MTTTIDTILHAYITAALWSSTDDNDEPLDANYDQADIAPGTMASMRADCTSFYNDHRELCDTAIAAYASSARGMQWSGADLLGHDFWLTRNGHGAGFWDRKCLEPDGIGAKLTALVGHGAQYGTVDLYVGDDGKVHS